jgi:hypothetical protein
MPCALDGNVDELRLNSERILAGCVYTEGRRVVTSYHFAKEAWPLPFESIATHVISSFVQKYLK